MKVLWFTVSPSLAAGNLNIPVVGRGWIASLQEKIMAVNDIDLAVAFVHGKKELNRFTHDKATYYAIPSKGGRLKGFIDRHFSILNDGELVKYCIEVINDFKPDVIHIFGTEEAFGLICDKVKVPVVIHLQGLLTVYEKKWFPPGIGKFDLLKSSGVSDILRANTLIKNYKYYKKASIREQQIFKKGKYFIGRTDWDKRVSAVLAPGTEYFFGSEILRKDFYSHLWSYSNRESKIFVSTIQANIYKGLETVLECAILLRNLNKFNFKWIVAGISSEDIVVRVFEKKIGKKFKDYNIILSGKLAAVDLINIQLVADIFIHPSHIDNSPNSVCEGMLLGMPIIATYTGGTGSLIIDKKEGVLIQDGDPYSMAGAIWELIRNPEYAAELGKNARLRALERHNPDGIVANLMSIYSKIVAKKVK